MKIFKTDIGEINHRIVSLFRLENSQGSYVELINFGAGLVAVVVPDRNGDLGNVVLGFPSLDGYLQDQCYIGSTIGRYANRIGNASFVIRNVTYQLDRNDDLHSNHGGFAGFHSKVFDSEIGKNTIKFSIESTDGEGGFPGNLKFSVSYSWNEENELLINYQAETDRETVVNFTNHAYFNLSATNENALNQILDIKSSSIVECSSGFIPTGKIVPTGKLDFNNQRIREKMNWQAVGFKGINSYFIFDERSNDKAQCCLIDDKSGRTLEIATSYPGVQLYTGDYLESGVVGSQGFCYRPFDGICLECQYYPDSPNHPDFPPTTLLPGGQYVEEITYKFNVITS